MKSYPKNKSEKSQLPKGFVVVLASVLAVGFILFIINWRARRHSAIPIVGSFATNRIQSGEVGLDGFRAGDDKLARSWYV